MFGKSENGTGLLFRNMGSESPSPADFAMIYCQLLNRMDHCNYMSLLIFTVTTRMCQPHKVLEEIYTMFRNAVRKRLQETDSGGFQ